MVNGARRKRTIVVVGAHPDDETLGCGGSVARRIQEGYEVRIVVLTDGEHLLSVFLGIGSDPSPDDVARLRKEETRRAAAILGVPSSSVLFLGYEDGGLAGQKERATEQLAGLLREWAPAEVWSLSGYEQHPDHVAAAEIVRAACCLAGGAMRRLQYVVSLRKGLSLDAVPLRPAGVDVSAYVSVKKQALGVFQSHLGTLSRDQKKPLAESFDQYLVAEEPFFEGE
jgi:LmbE family N-acetylglucosaminyl deacetylase